MTRIEPITLATLEQASADLNTTITAAMAKTMTRVADLMATRATGQPLTAAFMDPGDLVVVGSEWQALVDGELVPVIEQMYRGSSVAWTMALQQSDSGWAAAPIPPVSQAQVEEYLAGARNRLVGVSDDLWVNARQQLLEGIDAGESIPELAARVADAAALTEGRAHVVSRTETVSAFNAGSIDTARLLGVDMVKVWEATGDARTRPDHAEAQGQERPIDEPFDVGGVALDVPGDPSGPPEAVINCRCTVVWEIPDEPELPNLPEAWGEDALDVPPVSLTRQDDVEMLLRDELDALRQYKSGGYDNLNNALRRERGQMPDSFGFQWANETAAALDQVLARSALPRPVLVERGIADGAAVFGDAWVRALTGAGWTEHGYVSTSASDAVARGFAGAAGAVLRIRVPAGVGAVTMSGSNYESELLLERGLRLRVVADTGPGPNRIIDVEVVR